MSLSISGGFNDYIKQLNMSEYDKSREAERKERMGIEDPIAKKVKEEREEHLKDCECETCKNRKYQDGSNEMVSFKTAQHIPTAAVATRVRGHEQEHVANAYSKAAQNNGKVIQASVAIHTAVCPECGRTYVSGGTTTTRIAYYNEDNPYQQALKTQDATKYAGMNVDEGV